MKLNAFQYDDLKELNNFFRKNKTIDEDNYQIMELEHTKSKNGKIRFVNTKHKATQKRLLKKLIIILVTVIILYIVASQIFENIRITGLAETFLSNAIIGALILPVVWFFKLITLSKTVLFEKNLIYSPMLIGSHFIADFDEIKLASKENFKYAIFYYKGKPAKRSIVLISNNEQTSKILIDFVKGYADKAKKKLTNEL
jgi:hypothetical protein